MKKNPFKSISTKISEMKKERAERKFEKQEMEELAGLLAQDLKEMADKMALISLAKRMEDRAKKIRDIAKEM